MESFLCQVSFDPPLPCLYRYTRLASRALSSHLQVCAWAHGLGCPRLRIPTRQLSGYRASEAMAARSTHSFCSIRSYKRCLPNA